MIRQFMPGNKVYFTSTAHGRSISSGGGNMVIVNQGTNGIVTEYNKKGTEEIVEDDFIGVQITEGDQEGQIVWLPFAEWTKIKKIGY